MIEYIWLLWFIPAPVFCLFFYRFIQNRQLFINKDLENVPSEYPYLIILVTSKYAPKIVDEVVDRVHSVARKIGMAENRYRVEVLVDEINRDIKDANIILVPPQYKTNKGTLRKGRALQYALEQRRERKENNKKIWILHLDEESFVTEQCMISVLKYISKETNPPMSEGAIIYSNKFFEVNVLCRTIECLRPYICYDCVSEMMGKMPAHIHGSNLLVRSDIEDGVGWDHLNPASEDQRFGWEVWKRYGPVFGWHGGVLEEQPPYTIKDMIRQRRRWFIGNCHNLLTCTGIPTMKKVEIELRWLSWGLGFLSVSSTIAVRLLGALGIIQNIPQWLDPFLIFNMFIWLVGFQIGLRHNIASMKLSFTRQLRLHLATLIWTFPAGIFDTWAVFSAPLYMRNFVWRPTEKDKVSHLEEDPG